MTGKYPGVAREVELCPLGGEALCVNAALLGPADPGLGVCARDIALENVADCEARAVQPAAQIARRALAGTTSVEGYS